MTDGLMTFPEVSFSTLPYADGSASYKWQGYHIVGAVNGPLEPLRRDELTEEAYIEVNVRQASGAGGTRERYLESIVHSTIRSIILTHLHPRTLLQVTLQILSTPESEDSAASVPQSASHIPPLPHLLHTALLSLLSANIALSKTFTSTSCGVGRRDRNGGGASRISTSLKELEELSSIHAFALSSTGDMLMAESEGQFDTQELHNAVRVAEDTMKPLSAWLRKVVTDEVQDAARWRGS